MNYLSASDVERSLNRKRVYPEDFGGILAEKWIDARPAHIDLWGYDDFGEKFWFAFLKKCHEANCLTEACEIQWLFDSETFNDGKPFKERAADWTQIYLDSNRFMPLEKDFIVFLPCIILPRQDRRDFRIELPSFVYQDRIAMEYLYYKSESNYKAYIDDYFMGDDGNYLLPNFPDEEFEAFQRARFYGESQDCYLTGLPVGNYFVEVPKVALEGLERYYE